MFHAGIGPCMGQLPVLRGVFNICTSHIQVCGTSVYSTKASQTNIYMEKQGFGACSLKSPGTHGQRVLACSSIRKSTHTLIIS